MDHRNSSPGNPAVALPRNLIPSFIIAGPVFFVVHLAAAGPPALRDWSWLLAAVITTAAVFLSLATHVLGLMIEQMDWRLSRGHSTVRAKDLYKGAFSDRNFLLAAIGFGVLNALMGFSFGLPYCKVWEPCRRLSAFAVLPNDTIMLGYVLAGMICGMAAFGIAAVCLFLVRFSRHARATFEPGSPDGCAGTSYIGEAVIVFSVITLIVGVMISIYILQTAWTGPKTDGIAALKTTWVFFPYLMSLAALLIPAVPLMAALHDFKFHRQMALQNEDAALRASLKDPPASATERLRIATRLQSIATELNDLYQVRIWPFSTGASTKYFTVVAGNLLVQVGTMLKFLPTWLMKLFGA
jgi:hypothetical protein